MLVTAAVVAGIILCLRAPRTAALTFLGSAIVGVIITPFVVAVPALFLLNASGIVFFGRKENPTKLTKRATPPVGSPAAELPPAEPAEAT